MSSLCVCLCATVCATVWVRQCVYVCVRACVCKRVPSIWVAGGAANYLQKHAPKKKILSKSWLQVYFNNVNFTFSIYSFCRLADYFWSDDIKLWNRSLPTLREDA